MEKEFRSCFILTLSPLAGVYRYKDIFQIYPADFKGIPKSKYADHYISILEYWIDKNEIVKTPESHNEIKDLSELTIKTGNKENQILRLLSSLTNHRFFKYDIFNGKWGISVDNSPKSSTSSWFMPIIHYPKFQKDLVISGFTNTKLSSVVKTGIKEYFKGSKSSEPNIDFRAEPITFPDTIDFTLESYFNQDKKTQKVVDSSCTLICNGFDIKKQMKSLSFISLVSSIETMVSLEFKKEKIEHCQDCKQPKYKVADKYRKYLIKYVSQTKGSIDKFNKIYSLRSKIAHRGSLLLGDDRFDWESDEQNHSESIIHIETLQLSRISLTFWLLHKNPKVVFK